MADKKELSSVLKDKFKMAQGFPTGEYVFKGQKIDLSICDLKTVEDAVANGFDVVVAIGATLDITPKKK